MNLDRPSRATIVVLFCETLEENTEVWENVASLLKYSKNCRLILVDKTVTSRVTKFFSSTLDGIVPIEFRISTKEKSLEDSMCEIKLGENEWIIQLHHDDLWSGRLSTDCLIGKPDILQYKFSVRQGELIRHAPSTLEYPNQIYYSLIGFRIWNLILEFARIQGGTLPSSADTVISFIVKQIAFKKYSSEFEYEYNDHKWADKKFARERLTAITRREGWSKYSSPHIAVVSRSLDTYTFLWYLGYQKSSIYTLADVRKSSRRLLLSLSIRSFLKAFRFSKGAATDTDLVGTLVLCLKLAFVHSNNSLIGSFKTLEKDVDTRAQKHIQSWRKCLLENQVPRLD